MCSELCNLAVARQYEIIIRSCEVRFMQDLLLLWSPSILPVKDWMLKSIYTPYPHAQHTASAAVYLSSICTFSEPESSLSSPRLCHLVLMPTFAHRYTSLYISLFSL